MDRRPKIETVKTTSSTFSLEPYERIENLAYLGESNFKGTGNSADNLIRGSIGNDTLDGLAGADTLEGSKGNDVYVVDNEGDLVTELSGQGTDEIRTSLASYSLASLSNVENITYTGTAAFTGTGNDLGNVITGAGGADIIRGGNGSDDLIGNGGDDTLKGGRGSDWLSGGEGNDRLESADGLGADSWDVDTLIGGDGTDTFVYQRGGKAIINDFEAGETLLLDWKETIDDTNVNIAYDSASGDSTITFGGHDSASYSIVLLDYDATSLDIATDGPYLTLGGDFA